MAEENQEFDPTQIKVVDDNGEAQDINIPEPPKEEEEPTEEVQEVENTEEKVEEPQEKEEETKEEEVTLSRPEKSDEESDSQEEGSGYDTLQLFDELDQISKDLTGGKAETLEQFFDEFKRMRDSNQDSFKDDYIKNAVDYYNANGNLTPYLEATAVNYTEMTDEQVMRYDLQNQNPSLSKRAIEKLFDRDIVSKYNLDEDKFNEDDVELGKELLKADASKLRDKFVDEQKKFAQPQPVKTDGKQEVNQEAAQKEQMDKWVNSVQSNTHTKDVVENKRIMVQYGDNKFSYEVDNPKDLQEMTEDNNKFFQLFRDESGDIDFEKWYKVLAFAVDPEVYDSSLISHGQELGQEKVVSDLKNPSKPTKSSQEYRSPKNPLEGLIGALARGDSDVKIIR